MTPVGENEAEADEQWQARHLAPGVLPQRRARRVGGPEIIELERRDAVEQYERLVVVSFRFELLPLIEPPAQDEAPPAVSRPARLEELDRKAVQPPPPQH